MINKSKCTKLLLKEFPEFKKDYKDNEYLYKDGKEILLTVVMGQFATSIVRRFIEKNRIDKLKKACNFIEELIIKGDNDVNYAAKFGFLEAITNNPDHIERLTKCLGGKSKKFCKELDKFWGTRTKGI